MGHSNSANSNKNDSNPSDAGLIMSDKDDTQKQAFVVSKIKKIAQALYVLTNYLDINEPFRQKVREKSLNLIDELYRVQIQDQAKLNILNQIIVRQFPELIAILQIGVRAGLMSEMNYGVIESEMTTLKKTLASMSDKPGHTFESNFFKDTNRQHPDQIAKQLGFESNIPDSDQTTSNNTDQIHKFSSVGSQINDPKAVAGADNHMNRPKSNSGRSRRRHGSNHSKRRRGILGLFSDNEEITINDVQEVIEGCSQKTMQRELKSMVEDGLLEKHGKRRWSSYTLGEGITLNQELNQ
jgi:hypothetical protein